MLWSGHWYPSAYPACVPRNASHVHDLLMFFANLRPKWSIPSAPPGSRREPPWVPGPVAFARDLSFAFRANRVRPLRASSVVGATDDCRSTVWVLLLRALAYPIDAHGQGQRVWRWRPHRAARRHHSGPARLCRTRKSGISNPCRSCCPFRREEDLAVSGIRFGGRTAPPATFLDFFTEICGVDCFSPSARFFLRTPCAEIWPRQRRA